MVLLALAAAAAATLVAGCREASSGDRIDVPALERELESVLALQLDAQGFVGTRVDADCVGTEDDGLHVLCHAVVTRTGEAPQDRNVTVSCLPEREPGLPRCVTEGGDALQ